MMFTFCLFFDQKYSFWVNLVQKIEAVSFSRNLMHRLIRICWTEWWSSLFSFLTQIFFLGNFGSKIQDCLLQVKPGTQTKTDMKNPIVMFTFIIFCQKYYFEVNLDPKIKNCLFKVKFDTYTNSNLKNLVVMFIFSVLVWKHPRLGKLFHKIKLFVEAEFWNLTNSNVELNGEFQFFIF